MRSGISWISSPLAIAASASKASLLSLLDTAGLSSKTTSRKPSFLICSETVDWVRRQNAFSGAQLAALPERPWFAATMAAVHRGPGQRSRTRRGPHERDTQIIM